MRKIAVATGTRADYGLLRWVMEGIRDAPDLELQVIASAMHLSPEFGLTYREIEGDGFAIDQRVEMLLSSDTPTGISKSMGLGMIGFGGAFAALRPDLLILLGDRFEAFCAAASALVARVPIAHIHGGETTEGAFDEGFRHAITKMSHLHFVAAKEYRHRVVQLGEQPESVFLVGGLGVDGIRRQKLLDRPQLEEQLQRSLAKRNLLITFHPVTLEQGTAADQMAELLAALEDRSDTGLIFTMPNADTEGRALFDMIETFVAAHSNASVFTSLGQLRYLSCLAAVDGVVGNSSSGLTEAPSFRKGTVNIGDRQRGRLRAASVIDVAPTREAIAAGIERLYSDAFQKTLTTVSNPYGDGGASARIVDVLRSYRLDNLLKKPFYDLACADAAAGP